MSARWYKKKVSWGKRKLRIPKSDRKEKDIWAMEWLQLGTGKAYDNIYNEGKINTKVWVAKREKPEYNSIMTWVRILKQIRCSKRSEKIVKESRTRKLYCNAGNMKRDNGELRQKWAKYFLQFLNVYELREANIISVASDERMYVFGDLIMIINQMGDDGGIEVDEKWGRC